jgi:hypothetical protein
MHFPLLVGVSGGNPNSVREFGIRGISVPYPDGKNAPEDARITLKLANPYPKMKKRDRCPISLESANASRTRPVIA